MLLSSNIFIIKKILCGEREEITPIVQHTLHFKERYASITDSLLYCVKEAILNQINRGQIVNKNEEKLYINPPFVSGIESPDNARQHISKQINISAPKGVENLIYLEDVLKKTIDVNHKIKVLLGRLDDLPCYIGEMQEDYSALSKEYFELFTQTFFFVDSVTNEEGLADSKVRKTLHNWFWSFVEEYDRALKNKHINNKIG
ncbi:hypothetical protein CDIK_2088 [Cucumispora dikerogammari]|nr:hypothetical protein CDIK_2088 [Cucumispora dikerogammari]